MKTLSEPIKVEHNALDAVLLAVDDENALIESRGYLQLVTLRSLHLQPWVRNVLNVRGDVT